MTCYGLSTGFDYSNLHLFTISLYHLQTGGMTAFMEILAEQAIKLNGLILLFNLFIPAYPLDGGRCLAALLVQAGTPVTRAAILTATTAMAVAVLLLVSGVFLLMIYGQGLLMILVAVYIMASSRKLLHLAQQEKACDHPLFRRACYRHLMEQERRNNGYGYGGDTEMSASGSRPIVIEEYGL